MESIKLSRRQFMISSAIAAGGLILSYQSKANNLQVLSADNLQNNFDSSDAWIHVSEDNWVTVKIPSSEMGQGTNTGIAMIVAEELDADWDKIKIIQAPLSTEFNNPRFKKQMTGGSTSISAFWMPVRKIAASARFMLIEAAAREWKVEASSIRTENSLLIGSNNQHLSYGEMANASSKITPPDSPKLKNIQDFKLVGKPKKRLDTRLKIDGSAVFGMDVQTPNLLIAAVMHAPVFYGDVQSIDKTAALNINGVVAVEPIAHGIAVIAKDYWTAQKGLKALKATFNSANTPLKNSQQIFAEMSAALDEEGKATLATDTAALDLEYQVPFLAHATMEPMNCTAHVQANRCDVWAPTQSQSGVAETAEKITRLNKKQIFVHTTYLGGGFGRRGETDFIAEAVTLSKKLQKPVKVIWSREQDIQHDFYRPACISRLQIQLDKQGNPSAWHNQFAAPSIFKRIFARSVPDWIPLTRIIGDPVSKEGASEPPYLEENINVEHLIVNLPVPVGFWRSVGHSYNAFFVESAIDEAAHHINADSYQYRRQLIANKHQRLLKVLDLAAKQANWGNSPYKQGIAVHQSFGSYVAQVVELEIDNNKNIILHRIVCAADCGLLVNPDSVITQMQSAIIYGLSAAVAGEISIENGAVSQSNFHDYPILRINQCPNIEVVLVDSEEAPSGAGEPGTPPIAPALCNAIFAANGERLRTLPISKAGYSVKLS